MPSDSTPPVTVLLAVYNGARHLPAQLASIAAQTGVPWRLIASDDGSTDASVALLEAFAEGHPGRVTVMRGPSHGFAGNFRALLARAPAGLAAAFCDQDDVWYPDKLARAAAMLAPVEGPGLYAARSRLVDDSLNPIDLSRGLLRPAGFANALVQNIASGNTMVLNPAAVALLQAASAEAGPVPMHDWWAYQVITGTGGAVVFDDRPVLDYRQHSHNQIGAGRGLAALRRRGSRVIDGSAGSQFLAQAQALLPSAHRFTARERARLRVFLRAMADTDPARRTRLLRRAGVYRQGRRADALFWAAVAMGRI